MSLSCQARAASAVRSQGRNMVASSSRVRSVVVRANEGAAATEKKPAFSAPTLNPDTPSPIFGGSTGGLLKKAQVREGWILQWASGDRIRRELCQQQFRTGITGIWGASRYHLEGFYPMKQRPDRAQVAIEAGCWRGPIWASSTDPPILRAPARP